MLSFVFLHQEVSSTVTRSHAVLSLKMQKCICGILTKLKNRVKDDQLWFGNEFDKHEIHLSMALQVHHTKKPKIHLLLTKIIFHCTKLT